MDLDTAGLHKHSFRLHGKPLTFVPYRSHEGALDFLREVYSQDQGLGVLEGPALSGKTTAVERFVQELPPVAAVARVDCTSLDSNEFLTSILNQYGFELDDSATNEQLNFLKVFLVQHTSTNRAPILFIENAHEMDLTTTHCLGQLIKTRYHNQSVLRVILIGDRCRETITSAAQMIGQQRISEYSLQPMTATETKEYLVLKLLAAGCDEPESVVPPRLCKDIFNESKGYPGHVDRLMLLRLQEADELPLGSSHQGWPLTFVEDKLTDVAVDAGVENAPELFVSLNGKTLRQMQLDRERTLIGRSELNDITIDSSCVSRYHAMLVRQGGALLLMDLNSCNGVFVNSKRVTSRVLCHDDVISLGDHRIKVLHSSSRQRVEPDGLSIDDTETMKALEDTLRINTKTGACAAGR